MAMDMMGSNSRFQNEQIKKEQHLLQKGDIIRLEPSMKVYMNIPRMFRGGAAFDLDETHADVKIGQVYKREAPSAQDLVEQIFKKLKEIVPVSQQQVSAFVDSLNLDMEEKVFDSSVYAGEYEVYQTLSNGGGYGGGGFCPDSVPYPNGWHVYCHKVDNPSVKVDFYQTGCFTAMIEDIEPINR